MGSVMKCIKLCYLLLLLTFLTNSYLFCKEPSPEWMMFNSAQGREFWIAIPPNEADGQPLGNTNDISIDIYVTSGKNTTVTLEVPGLGLKITKPVEAMKITKFSTQAQETSFTWEVRESEVVVQKAIHIYADQPLSVYVLNHRNVTSDGYLAIPTSACGTDYIHLAYYDFYENLMGGLGERRGGGFIVTATEDYTTVSIQLRGRGGNYAQTLGGHKIGDSWQVTLSKGDLYCVMGDGTTRGVFDISGSRVRATKPVGFISFHKRTLIPSFDLYNGRNCLMEMIPPVSAWGKKYSTVEFARNNHGDFFRIIASEPNTKYTVKWYDLKTEKLIGQRSGELKNSGDFHEFEEVFVPRNTQNDVQSIRGTSVWQADKPVLVMQYSYSLQWDNAPEFDPFMILVVPEEQFIPQTVFQTPDEQSTFLTNWFNIVAVGDTTDPSATKLKSIKLDNKPIWTIEPSFPLNRIPTTNLYWAKIFVTPGPHHIKGDTKFGGYIYGFASADGYGWPAAMAVNKIDETDTLPPELYPEGKCGDYTIEATELRNGKIGDDPRQVDQGINQIELLEGSYNYELIFPNPFKPYPPLYRYTFELKVIDHTKDAFALYSVTDRYGNYTIDSVSYLADSLSLNPNYVRFGNVRVNTTKTLKVTLKNEKDSIVPIKAIKLKKGKEFIIVSGGIPPEKPFDLPPKATYDLTISYTPIKESLKPDILDIDSIIVETDCADFIWPVDGRGVIPKILVEDWDAGSVIVNETQCKKPQTGEGLKIMNVGTDTLIITDIVNLVAPFSLSTPYSPIPPIIIPPGETVYIVDVCFTPTDTLTYKVDVTFKSNAEGLDSVSTLTGKGIIPGPYVTSKNWEERRVKTINDSVVYVRNKGNTGIVISGINLGTPSNDFKIVNVIPDPRITPVTLMPENDPNPDALKQIQVIVRYEPQDEGVHHNTVVPVFDDINIIPGSVFGNLDGIGILPKIEVTGYEFLPPILVNTTHPDEGYVTIKSTSQSADLWIEDIKWKDPNQNEFSWVGTLPTKIKLNRGTEIKVPVTFTAKGVNRRFADVEVVSDAAPGPEVNPRITTATTVIGYGYETGLIVDSINFGRVLLCDMPSLTFHIENTSSTTQARIDSVVIIEKSSDEFEIRESFPKLIEPGGTLNVIVRYKPSRLGKNYAIARVYSDAGNDYYVLIEGIGYNVRANFYLKRWTSQEQIKQGIQIAPGITIPMDISVQSPDPWNDVKFTQFEIEITYSAKWMLFKSIEKGELLDGSWNINVNEIRNDDTVRLVITGTGTTPVSANGILVKPFLQVLLCDRKEFEPFLIIKSLGDKDDCVVTSSEPGYVIMNTCVIDLRNVIINETNYDLQEIEPNPVNQNTAKIKFSVGLKTHTKIEIFNYTGEVVATIVDSEKAPGIYEAIISVKEFPSGAYYVRMSSGPFVSTKRMIINK